MMPLLRSKMSRLDHRVTNWRVGMRDRESEHRYYYAYMCRCAELPFSGATLGSLLLTPLALNFF